MQSTGPWPRASINDQHLAAQAEPPILESGEPLLLHLVTDQPLCGSLMILQTALYQGYSEPPQPTAPLVLLEQPLRLQAGTPWAMELTEQLGPGVYQVRWQGKSLGSFMVVD